MQLGFNQNTPGNTSNKASLTVSVILRQFGSLGFSVKSVEKTGFCY
jgi:hypothetical protein